jgi:hypothetical protein
MNTLIAIAGVLIAAALQARMPTLGWLGGVRLEFLPALVAYASLSMPRRRAVALALVAGMMQDALYALDRDMPWVQLGAGALTSAAATVVAFFVIGISFGAVFKMVVVASISGIIAVMLFFMLDYTRMAWGNT